MSTSLVWAPFRADHPLAQALGVRETLQVPFLAMGEEVERVPRGGVDFGPKHLLYGILVGYHDEPPTVDVEAIRPKLRPILEGLWQGFQMESLEHAVLSVAANLREGGYLREGRAALATGRTLLPNSSQIASDFVMVTWEHVKEAHQSERPTLWSAIDAAIGDLEYNDLMAAVRESIAYMHFTAVRCLGKVEAIERVLHDEVFVHVEQQSLKVKIKRAIEDSSGDPTYLYS